MMKCPRCKKITARVYSCNDNKNQDEFKRYRICRNCGRTFTTIEKYYPDDEVRQIQGEQLTRIRRRKNGIKSNTSGLCRT